jgi:hypothetical protein
MHHRISSYDRNKPILCGGAAAALPPPTITEETAIDRRLNELREMTLQVQPIRRLLDTGPPPSPACLAA